MLGHNLGRRARTKSAVAVMSGALMLLGPGIAASASSAKAASPQKTVACNAPATVNVGFNSTPNNAPYYDLGYTNFVGPLEAHCHTLVNLIYFSSPTATLAALLGGSVQYVMVSTSALLAALQQNTAQNVVFLAPLNQGGGTVVAAAIKYRSNGIGMQTLKDYANVTWGLPTLNGVGVAYYNQALKSEGVNPATLSTIAVGSGALTALENGKVSVAASSAVSLEPAVENGSAFFLWDTFGLDAYKLTGLVPAGGLMTLNTTISQYHELTQLITDVTIKNLLFMQKNVFHPQTIYNDTQAAFKAVTSYTTFAQSWPLSRASGIPLTGLVTQSGLQRVANIFYNNGVIVGPVRIAKSTIDTSFVTNAYKSMGLVPPTSQVNPKLLYLLGDKYTGLQSR